MQSTDSENPAEATRLTDPRKSYHDHGACIPSRVRTLSQFFPREKRPWEYIDEPWTLFYDAWGNILQQGGALLLVFWLVGGVDEVGVDVPAESHIASSHTLILDCHSLQGHTTSVFAMCMCSSTKMALRSFPMLGVSVIMAVRLRMVLQRRLYYRMLAHDMLLDFTNCNPRTDFVFWVLLVSMLMGWGHFALLLWFRWSMQTFKLVVTQGLVPTGLFLLFFTVCCNIEKLLITLNDFFEGNRDHAKASISEREFTCMDEKYCKEYVLHHWEDMIAKATDEDYVKENVLKDLDIELDKDQLPGLQAVLINLRKHYIDSDYGKLGVYQRGNEFHRKAWFRAMWPGLILLDPRLKDKHSVDFRRMFATFLCMSLVVQLGVFVIFGIQGYRNVYYDAYLNGHTHDVCAGIVAGIHMFVVGLMLWNISSSFATQFYKLLGYKLLQKTEEVKVLNKETNQMEAKKVLNQDTKQWETKLVTYKIWPFIVPL